MDFGRDHRARAPESGARPGAGAISVLTTLVGLLAFAGSAWASDEASSSPPPLGVLVHTGHGSPGAGPQGRESWRSWAGQLARDGVTVDVSERWPSRLEPLHLLVLDQPGAADDSGTHDFAAEELDDLLHHLAAGGRILIVTDEGRRGGRETQNRLLRRLHVGIRVSEYRMPRDQWQPLTDHQLTRTWEELQGHRGARLDVTPPARSLAGSGAAVVLAVGRSALTACGMPGCDIVVLGDREVLLAPPGGLAPAGRAFAQALVDPDGFLGGPWRGAERRCERIHPVTEQVSRATCLELLSTRLGLTDTQLEHPRRRRPSD